MDTAIAVELLSWAVVKLVCPDEIRYVFVTLAFPPFTGSGAVSNFRLVDREGIIC